MKQWSKVIEENWDSIIDAMQKAAKDVCGSDGESVLRVELNEDGTVDTYWTQENITSADVHDGKAIRIRDYSGGPDYFELEEWADTYDAAVDLEGVLHFARQDEQFYADYVARQAADYENA